MQNREDCNASALDWANLVLTVITTHVTWWALHLPTLVRKGVRPFVDAVAWECLRLHQPGYAGCIAYSIFKRRDWQAKYYTGRAEHAEEDMSLLKRYAAPLVIDVLVVVASVVSICRLALALRKAEGEGEGEVDLSGWNTSLWMYPSLPVALVGLWIAGTSRTSLRVRWVVLGHVLLVAATGAGIALALHFSDTRRPRRNVWIAGTVAFGVMGLPLVLALCMEGRTTLLFVALAALARSAGPIGAALSREGYFPFCALRGPAFGAPLVVLAVLAALFALYGVLGSVKDISRDAEVRLERVRRREARERRRREMESVLEEIPDWKV